MSDLIAIERPHAAKTIAAWLTRLARLVRHNGAMLPQERGTMVAEYTEMLLRTDLPVAAFNLDALHHVAGDCEWWPAFSVLATKLQEHWNITRLRMANRQYLRIDGTDNGDPVSQDEKSWLQFWNRNEAVGWKHDGETIIDEDTRVFRRNNGLSLIRRFSTNVFQHVTEEMTDDRCERQNWQNEEHLATTLNALKDHPCQVAMLRVIYAAVKKHAPQSLAMIHVDMSDLVQDPQG